MAHIVLCPRDTGGINSH